MTQEEFNSLPMEDKKVLQKKWIKYKRKFMKNYPFGIPGETYHHHMVKFIEEQPFQFTLPLPKAQLNS